MLSRRRVVLLSIVAAAIIVSCVSVDVQGIQVRNTPKLEKVNPLDKRLVPSYPAGRAPDDHGPSLMGVLKKPQPKQPKLSKDPVKAEKQKKKFAKEAVKRENAAVDNDSPEREKEFAAIEEFHTESVQDIPLIGKFLKKWSHPKCHGKAELDDADKKVIVHMFGEMHAVHADMISDYLSLVTKFGHKYKLKVVLFVNKVAAIAPGQVPVIFRPLVAAKPDEVTEGVVVYDPTVKGSALKQLIELSKLLQPNTKVNMKIVKSLKGTGVSDPISNESS
jgi:hypothetical protein